MTAEMLQDAFVAVGKDCGYEDITAEFSPLADVKLRWQRSFRWIHFEVSDYLQDAPYEVLKALAQSIFSRIRGEDNAPYPQEAYEYVRANADALKPTYIARHRPHYGNRTDLDASVQRLIDGGYIP